MTKCSRGAERLVAMAERQAAHRQKIESAVIEGDLKLQRHGQVMAFSLSGLVAIGGGILLWSGHELGGLAALVTALGVPMGILLVKREQQKRELASKRPETQLRRKE
jgi:uncharacterized membrane protein